MEFETEYQLQEFRKIQGQYFDSNGNAEYGYRFGKETMEQMLKLINQLEIEILNKPKLNIYDFAHGEFANCCGIFDQIDKEGSLICNECGEKLVTTIERFTTKLRNCENCKHIDCQKSEWKYCEPHSYNKWEMRNDL